MNKYTYTGWTPIADGGYYVYEIDWDLIHKVLAPRARANKSQQTVVGPLRIRVVKDAEEVKRGSLRRDYPLHTL